MSEIRITKDNFSAEVLNSKEPVIVDFWAVWCGPCRMVAPILSEIAEENDGKVKVGKVNVDEEQELAAQFQIQSIPSLLLFKDGKFVSSLIGYHPKEEILKMIK